MERKRLIAIGAGALALVVALGLVVWLASGSDDRETVATAPAAAGPAPAAPASAPAGVTPLTFKVENEHVIAELSLPETIKANPGLHALLYAEGARDLQAFADGAAADRKEMEGEGLDPRPYAKAIEWKPAGETGKLQSLRALVYEDTGGAHPNAAFTARLWDKAMQKPVDPRALFAPRADMAALDAALCDAVKAAKRERTGEDWTPDDSWPCPKLLDAQIVLAEGPAGRAGGLLVLLSPYMVGPWAEGAYEIPLPASVLRPHLAPAYADEFAG
jgi:hypothetical protein